MLANHGRWLAKGLPKGSASDRPRQTSLYCFLYMTLCTEHFTCSIPGTSTAAAVTTAAVVVVVVVVLTLTHRYIAWSQNRLQ